METKELAIMTKKQMLDKNLKQVFIAKQLNVTESAISRALSGNRRRLLNRVHEYVQTADLSHEA